MKSVRIAALLTLTAYSTAASAQSDAALDRVEARLDRLERREPPRVRLGPGETETHPWELSFSLPFTWNSNVASAPTNPDAAFHADPTITLGKKWDVGSSQFFFEANADSDAYTAHSENDSSTLSAQAGVRFGDASTGVAPYVHYTVLALYAGQLDAHDVTIHHFTVGAKRSWTAGEHGRLILDVNALRREATLRTVEQTRGTTSLTYAADIDDTTSWSLSARGQYAHYTGGTSSGRDDAALRLLGGVTFLLGDHATLDIQASFQRNWSDRAGKEYSVWDIGPTIGFSTRF